MLARLGAMLAHLGSMLGAMFAHLGGYVGAMLPGLGPLLDHVVGDVGPSGTRRGDLGLCCFHDFTVSPKILLENALPSGLRGTHSIFATLFP